MKGIFKNLLRFDDSITAGQLRKELQNLANQWLILILSTEDVYVVQKDSDNENRTNPLCTRCKSCKGCPICCYNALLKLNLFTDAYKSILSDLPTSCCCTVGVSSNV